LVFLEEDITLVYADVEFHTVSNAPTLYRVNVRLNWIAVLRKFNGWVNFDIVRKK
jgi:hypothetical protein